MLSNGTERQLSLKQAPLKSLKVGMLWSHIRREVKLVALPRVTSVVAVHGAEVLLPWVLYREREQAIFTSVCAATRLRFKAELQRGV